MKRYGRQDQRLLAIWAADCAERVLPFFEREYPKDNRPRKAIKKCREWIRTGVFRMKDVRKASLSAHAAARKARENDAACFAARAAGQALATAHVAEHAFGPAYYALKAVAAANPADAGIKMAKEIRWQTWHLPERLRKGWKDWQMQRLPKNLKQIMLNKKKIKKKIKK
jgi:hypothetical protein